ncbi:AP5Z1 (predicted) [Pycnogonum litorale]
MLLFVLFRIVQDAMLKMLKTYPELMVVHRAEITDYVAVVRNFTLSSNFYINMVWAFGEYTSPTYVDNCRAEMITTIYETLECILFEIYSVLEEKGNYFVLTCVLATALAKLASRCQDLVPRVILCLSKIVIEIRGTEDDDHEYRHIVVNRLNELIAVLKMPNAAAIIMSPPKNHDERKWHRDNCSIEMFVKTINVVLTDST